MSEDEEAMLNVTKALSRMVVWRLIEQAVLFSRTSWINKTISIFFTCMLALSPVALCITASTAIRWPDWNPTVLVGLSIMTFALMSVTMDFSIIPALALSILAVNSAQSDLYTRYRYYRSQPNRRET